MDIIIDSGRYCPARETVYKFSELFEVVEKATPMTFWLVDHNYNSYHVKPCKEIIESIKERFIYGRNNIDNEHLYFRVFERACDKALVLQWTYQQILGGYCLCYIEVPS